MNKSIWGKIETNSNTTNKNIETDILIIGGGITGMTSLLYLLPNKIITIGPLRTDKNTNLGSILSNESITILFVLSS